MSESYISEIGDKFGGSGVANTVGEHVKIIAPKVYETTNSSIVNLTSAFAEKVSTGRTINDKALSADITLNADDVGAIATSARGAINGVASLGNDGKVPPEQLPNLQSLTAGTDLTISDGIVKVNTNGSANSAGKAFVVGDSTLASASFSFAGGYASSAFGNGSAQFVYGVGAVAAGEPIVTNTSTDEVDYSSLSTSLTSWSSAPALQTQPISANKAYFYPGITTTPTYPIDANDFTAAVGAQAAFGIDTTAIGKASIAAGYGSIAYAPYSFVAGKGNFTTDYGQCVVGMYCSGEPANTRFAVGVGSANDARKTGFCVTDSAVFMNVKCDVNGKLTSQSLEISESASIATATATDLYVASWYVSGYTNGSANNYYSAGTAGASTGYWFKNLGSATNHAWYVRVPPKKTAIISPVFELVRASSGTATACTFYVGLTNASTPASSYTATADVSNYNFIDNSWFSCYGSFGPTGIAAYNVITPTFYYRNTGDSNVSAFVRIAKRQNAAYMAINQRSISWTIF